MEKINWIFILLAFIAFKPISLNNSWDLFCSEDYFDYIKFNNISGADEPNFRFFRKIFGTNISNEWNTTYNTIDSRLDMIGYKNDSEKKFEDYFKLRGKALTIELQMNRTENIWFWNITGFFDHQIIYIPESKNMKYSAFFLLSNEFYVVRSPNSSGPTHDRRTQYMYKLSGSTKEFEEPMIPLNKTILQWTERCSNTTPHPSLPSESSKETESSTQTTESNSKSGSNNWLTILIIAVIVLSVIAVISVLALIFFRPKDEKQSQENNESENEPKSSDAPKPTEPTIRLKSPPESGSDLKTKSKSSLDSLRSNIDN